MSVVIRLSRRGAKKKPCYHVVAADSRSPRDGKFLQKLGRYNPLLSKEHKERVVLDIDKIKYWVRVGAKPTATVMRLLKNSQNDI
ncbi:MAG: 30S ribosomal protein S16 [Proteobacteria bacterium]|nr:30S ribosomal protein S16 [Pseudomonadota bacterium]